MTAPTPQSGPNETRVSRGAVPRDRRQPRARPGFTLIELVTSMTVGAVISMLAGMLLWNATQQRSEVNGRSEMVDAGSAAVELMVRYLREIAQDECPGNPTPCLLGNAQVSSANATEIRFGNNGFRRNGSSIEMTADNAASWHTLCTDVGAFTLSYYNRTGSSLAVFPLSQSDREDIRRIHVTIDLARGGQVVRLRTGVYLRSFMDEVLSDP